MALKVRSYVKDKRLGNLSYRSEEFNARGYTSPRGPSGGLMLQDNIYDKSHRLNLHLSRGGPDPENSGRWPSPAPFGNVQDFTGIGLTLKNRLEQNASNMAYGKFQKSLRRGQGASMGMTLATMGQSTTMIVDRTQSVLDLVSKRIPPKRVRIPENMYLETVFGWVPLYEDAVNAYNTLVNHDPTATVTHVSARGKAVEGYSAKFNQGLIVEQGQWTSRVTWSATARVANPNLWLANKMGLINPLVVAWDLVPWSFVANMFGNFNQMLNSITDHVGLTFTSQSVTKTHEWTGNLEEQNVYYPLNWGRSAYRNFLKSRTVGSPLRPSLNLRVPELDLGKAGIASALLAQVWRKKRGDIIVHHHRYLTQTGKRIPVEYWNL